jgi:threonine/homoserine/homoserine lactone efflux protein
LQKPEAETISIWRGFFTSFLNPKGLLMYLAILPQFISPDGNTAVQALILSALFILGCGLVYSTVGISAAKAHGRSITDGARRRFEAVAGFMLLGAAVKLAM